MLRYDYGWAAGLYRWTILRGDKVEVISGPERGKQGTVLKVLRDENRVIIEGVNVVRKGSAGAADRLVLAGVYVRAGDGIQRRRTQKPSQGKPGMMITYPAALHVSRVHLIDPTTK